jgi:menaquinone-dependent protoporphyrinogen oxidase
MKILIAVASKHGGTQGIATRLRSELALKGHVVDILDIDEDLLPTEYDAYVVGSAVYAGRWMKSGRHYVHDHLLELRSKPLWLFSSGPLGEHADPDQAIDHPEEIGTLAGAREHKVFAGRLFRKELGPMERALAAAVHAPEGDFRDWAEVDAWADHIDTELRELATAHA